MRVAARVGVAGVGPDLATRAECLDQALTAGRDRLDPKAAAYARAVIDRTGERLRLGPHFTIVALVGATGSGKSTLFNALAGMDLAETGVRRPTTGRAMACVWGEDHAEALLDWLEVPRRHRTRRETILDADRESELRGLILLDMPDHDSTQVAHRLEVDRLVELVDLLVWVVDPQKYADEALHHGYLKRLHNHDGVMVVVLNQIDKLAPIEAETCKRDLRRLLDSDGLESVRLLVTSAATGLGVEDLRRLLAEVVDVQGAVAARAAADMDRAARRLMQSVADTEPDPSDLAGADELVGALAQAAGVPVVLDAVSADYRRQADQALGWPFLRWWGRLRPDPLRRLQLDSGVEGELREIARARMPEVSQAQRSRVELSVRQVVSGVTDVLPQPWADSVREVATRPDADLSQALDQAVASVDLELTEPTWWSAVRWSQLALAALAVVGFGWLALLGLLAFLSVDVGTPSVGAVPVPHLLLGVGLVGGLLLTLVAHRVAVAGATRRRMAVASQLRDAVQDAAWSHVIAPVAEVLNDHRTAREALQRSV